MDSQRTRRLLLVAFALSLLIHLMFAAGVRFRLSSPEESVEHVTILHRMRIARIVAAIAHATAKTERRAE